MKHMAIVLHPQIRDIKLTIILAYGCYCTCSYMYDDDVDTSNLLSTIFKSGINLNTDQTIVSGNFKH